MRLFGIEVTIRRAPKDKRIDALPPDFIPKIADETKRVRNALLRMEHDIKHNPYVQFGLDLEGLDDEQMAHAMMTSPMYYTVYHGVVPSAEMVALARSGVWRQGEAK